MKMAGGRMGIAAIAAGSVFFVAYKPPPEAPVAIEKKMDETDMLVHQARSGDPGERRAAMEEISLIVTEQAGLAQIERSSGRYPPWHGIERERLARLREMLLPVLMKNATDGDPAIRVLSVRCLGDLEAGESLKVLGQLVRDRESDVRQEVAGMISKIDAGPVIETAIHLILDPEPRVRRAAALGLAGYSAAFPAMLERLENDPDDSIRALVADILGTAMCEREALPALRRSAMEDRSAIVREAAREAVSGIRRAYGI